MKKRRLTGLVSLTLGAVSLTSASAAEGIVAESLSENSPFQYNFDTRMAVATNGAVVRYSDGKGRDVVLTANRISYSPDSGMATAQGGVTLRSGTRYWAGEQIEYDFFTGEIKGDTFRTGMAPFYAAGRGLSIQSNAVPVTAASVGTTNAAFSYNTFNATNAVITTDDVAEPGFHIRAKQITLLPDNSIEAKDAVMYAGKVPVMYFPYYSRRIDRHPNYWVVTPGYRSAYGPFLLTEYHYYVNDKIGLSLEMDERFKRGPGVGPGVQYDLGRAGHGNFKFYYTHDDKPGVDQWNEAISEDRHRIDFSHQMTLRTNLTVLAVVKEQSDPTIIHDFFESEYQKNGQPKSFVEVNQAWPNFTLNALAQPQVNTFWETVERLPDVKFSALPQQLGISPFYYESESSAAYLRYRSADNLSTNYAAFRGDSYHQFTMPKTAFGWLNITPRVGGRFTHYSEAEGKLIDYKEEDRWVFNTGAEVSTKISQTWSGVRNDFWEIDGIRHIIEPSVNYVYVPDPNVEPKELPQFDSELPAFQPISILYPEYNSIDSIDSQNVIRWGLRNKLQTKRNGQVDNLLNWALLTDWRLRPQDEQTTLSDAYSDLDFKPWSWLTLTSQTRYDIADGYFRIADHYVTITPNDTWSLSLGHRYMRSDPLLGTDYALGNNLIMGRLYYRFNENWGARISEHFEARDGVLEEQYYTLYRDFRSWTSALTLRIRDNRENGNDYTVAVTFSLKAFPRFGLGSDSETPSLLLGY
jgi:LPS-assembly protein